MPSRREALLTRRQHLLAALPPFTELVRGTFFVRHRRCGKPGCHCARGPGHRTAYLTVTFRQGATEQIALPPALEGLRSLSMRMRQSVSEFSVDPPC